jgi:4-hydroxy-tetrahydrodipicolinate reductase
MTLSIAIAGANGRMGGALLAAAREKRFIVAGSTSRANPSVQAAAAAADVWIDFTTPEATIAALAALPQTKVRAAVIGTTGLSPDQQTHVADAAKAMAVVCSGNFSLGVTLLAALVREAAQKLGPDWDIEIVEAHHRRKVDAPSGTALMLGEAAAAGRNQELDAARIAPRAGVIGPRPAGAIAISSLRGGGIIGEHEVIFASERETIKLSHQALDRALFADGALAAAAWAANKPPGLYCMQDVLGL